MALAALHQVAWATLHHAYGAAGDVPELLEQLLSPDVQVREKASRELSCNIWHQGTVYPASVAAVPFLIALLEAPETPDKRDVAMHLGCIIDGRGYLGIRILPEELAADYKEIEARNLTLFMGPAGTPSQAALLQACRAAAAPGARHLVPFLQDAEPCVIRTLALALRHFPVQAATLLPALRAAQEQARDAATYHLLSFCIKHLMPGAEAPGQIMFPAFADSR